MRSLVIGIGLLSLAFVGCATAPQTKASRESLVTQAQAVKKQMTTEDPALGPVLEKAYGYAIFPSVGAGGLVVGGAWGRGVVYEQGKMIGFADLSTVSAGAEAGGESYDELIVFENQAALHNMLNNNLKLTADASVVVLKPGAAAKTQFQNGTAIYIKPTGGAMVNVSVGGQSFNFVPTAQAGP